MNRKKLWFGITLGLIVLGGEIYYLLFHAEEQGMLFGLFCAVAAFVTNIRYRVAFDRLMHPKSRFEGWVPLYVEGQPDLNVLVFNFWKWVLLLLSCPVFLIIGTYTKK